MPSFIGTSIFSYQSDFIKPNNKFNTKSFIKNTKHKNNFIIYSTPSIKIEIKLLESDILVIYLLIYNIEATEYFLLERISLSNFSFYKKDKVVYFYQQDSLKFTLFFYVQDEINSLFAFGEDELIYEDIPRFIKFGEEFSKLLNCKPNYKFYFIGLDKFVGDFQKILVRKQ